MFKHIVRTLTPNVTKEKSQTAKTIVLAVPAWYAARYFLHTDILRTLSREQNTKVIALVHKDLAQKIRDEITDDNVWVQPLDIDEIRTKHASWFSSRLAQAARFVMNADASVDTAVYLEHQFLKRYEALRPRNRLTKYYLALIIRAGRWSRLFRMVMRGSGRLLSRPPPQLAFLRDVNADLLVLPSLGYFDVDAYLIRSARRHGVKTVGVVVNWDNTTNKGMTMARPDFALVWGEKMRREAIVHHDMAPNRVAAPGAAHYDEYFRPESFDDRATFCRARGLDPAIPIIVFAANSPRRYPHNPKVTEVLARAATDGSFGQRAQVLVRLHPIYIGFEAERAEDWARDMGAFERIQTEHPHVVVEQPAGSAHGMRTFDLDESDARALTNTLKHAAVVVCCFSTLNLEAALLDRPLVNCALYDFQDRWIGPGNRIYCPNHFHGLTGKEGFRVAYEVAELIAEVRAFLEQPERDAAYRRAVSALECGTNKGGSGVRVAQMLFDLANGRAPDSASAARADLESKH